MEELFRLQLSRRLSGSVRGGWRSSNVSLRSGSMPVVYHFKNLCRSTIQSSEEFFNLVDVICGFRVLRGDQIIRDVAEAMGVLLKFLKSIIDTDLGRSRVLDFQHVQKALNLTFDSGAMSFDGRVCTCLLYTSPSPRDRG